MPSSSAAADLGLGGMLTEQVAGETEEQRRKRMQQIGLSKSMGPAESLAVSSIFGAMGGPKSAGY